MIDSFGNAVACVLHHDRYLIPDRLYSLNLSKWGYGCSRSPVFVSFAFFLVFFLSFSQIQKRFESGKAFLLLFPQTSLSGCVLFLSVLSFQSPFSSFHGMGVLLFIVSFNSDFT